MSPCWLWTGGIDSSGYGKIRIGRRQRGVHRVAYELLVGPIPKPMLDHLCRVRRCCNPEHLRPVTNAENILEPRSRSRARLNMDKAECPRCGAGLVTRKNGWRYCRECQHRRQRVRRQKEAA